MSESKDCYQAVAELCNLYGFSLVLSSVTALLEKDGEQVLAETIERAMDKSDFKVVFEAVTASSDPEKFSRALASNRPSDSHAEPDADKE